MNFMCEKTCNNEKAQNLSLKNSNDGNIERSTREKDSKEDGD